MTEKTTSTPSRRCAVVTYIVTYITDSGPVDVPHDIEELD